MAYSENKVGCNVLLIDAIGPNQLAILSALIAIELSEGKTINEINVIGDFLIAIGSVMTTIAAQQQNQQEGQQNQEQNPNAQEQQSSNMQAQIQQLQEQLEELKKRIG
ncbi:MAG: hypothetical protein H6Q68_656 [Firmicutes bacterium]|nr:hypothetical protein [Bacillota bacterium]